MAAGTLTADGERALAAEVLARIAERENELQATLEGLIQHRAAIGRGERDAARDALRAEAMTARGELRRLRVVASMVEALLGPASLRPRSHPTRGAIAARPSTGSRHVPQRDRGTSLNGTSNEAPVPADQAPADGDSVCRRPRAGLIETHTAP